MSMLFLDFFCRMMLLFRRMLGVGGGAGTGTHVMLILIGGTVTGVFAAGTYLAGDTPRYCRLILISGSSDDERGNGRTIGVLWLPPPSCSFLSVLLIDYVSISIFFLVTFKIELGFSFTFVCLSKLTQSEGGCVALKTLCLATQLSDRHSNHEIRPHVSAKWNATI